MKIVGYLLPVLAICVSIIWIFFQPSFPPLIALISGLWWLYSSYCKKAKTSPDDFPRLNREYLETFSRRWLIKHPDIPIIKITLYRYSSKYFSDVKTKYALVFDIDPKIRQSKDLLQKYEQLQYSTGWLATVPDRDSSRDLGIDASFADVYKESPDKDFLEEWNFYARISDEEIPLGVMTSEPHWIFYEEKAKCLF